MPNADSTRSSDPGRLCPPLDLLRRRTLLAVTAHALLAVITANEHTDRSAPDGLIALTCCEVRRLFTIYVSEPGRALACPEAWSHRAAVISTAPATANTSASYRRRGVDVVIADEPHLRRRPVGRPRRPRR